MMFLFCCCSGVTKKDSKNNHAVEIDNVVVNDIPDEESVYDRFRSVFGRYYRTDYKDLPDWFGGTSEANKYNLVIYVVGDTKTGKEALEKMLDRSDFKVKQALFSYKHLRVINDSISSFIKNKKNKIINKEIGLSFSSLSEKDNRIYVYLDDCNNLFVDKFKEYVVNDNSIIFKQYENDAIIVAD